MSSSSVHLLRLSFLQKFAPFGAIAIAALLVIALLRLLAPAPSLGGDARAPVVVATPSLPATTSQPALADPDVATGTVVAQVNGVSLSVVALARATQVEQAMGALMAQPVVINHAQQLDQLINGEVVLQAAHASDFALAPGEEVVALDDWLAKQGRDRRALIAALARVDLTLADFQAEFTRLVTIDRFISQQAAATGVDRATLLRQWQATAHISFGPEANQQFQPAPVPTTPMVAEPLPIPAPTTAPATVLTTAIPRAAIVTAAPAPEHIGPFALWSAAQLLGDQRPVAAPTVAPPAVAAAEPATGLAPGNRAPTFTLPLLAAEQPLVKLADWRGQPVVLSFWTTWCPYCRKQTPVLVAAANSVAAATIHFIGINVGEGAATVEPYVAEQQIPYPVLLDITGEVAAQYLVRGYPTTYFLDAQGDVVAKHIGVLDANQMAGYLAQLAEHTAATPYQTE